MRRHSPAAALLALALTAGMAGGAHANTLVVCSEASPDSLNSALSTANTTFDVSEQIADRLVEMKIGGSDVVPGLAQSWTISPDGLVYTFKLRHGVKWQATRDFKPTRDFDADDVVFSFNRMLDPNNAYYKVGGGNYPMFGALIQPALASVEKGADDYTVVFKLKKPLAPLLSTLSVQPFSISSAEYAAAMLKKGTPDQLDLNPIGTGPFQLVQYVKDSLIRFRAFKDSWVVKGMPERAPRVDNLVFSITRDPSVRLARLQANECQVARYPNPADVPAMRASKGVKVAENTIASVSYLALRTDRKPFDDVRVRRALAMAIDMKSLVEAVYQGTGTPTSALVSAALWSHNGNLPLRAYDPTAAKKLLAEAGYPDGFSTDVWYIPVARAYMPDGKRAGEMIQADWAKIGVKAKLVTFEWGEYLRRVRLGESTVAMTGGTWDYPDPSQMMIGLTCEMVDAGRNVPHWCNKEFSELVQKANIVTDLKERTRLYEEAQRVFYDQVPGISFADAKAYVGVRDNVEGFRLHFFGGQPFGGVSLK